MKNLKSRIALLIAISFFNHSFAHLPDKVRGSNQMLEASKRAAGCAPATGLINLEYNNVRALIETGGSLWQDRAQSRAAYFVPASGNLSVLYSGSIWMGGETPAGNLKLAAVKYRQTGEDFWPGPLTVGNAEVDETTCQEFDRFYELFREDAVQHRLYYDAISEGNVDELFPNGYEMPEYFERDNYPAHGGIGQSAQLAPFYDYDDNDKYEPEEGDYPKFDVLNEIDCRALNREDQVPLFGDICYFWIFNDKGNIHTESQSEPIGMEIRAQAFSFATSDEINNMTFYNYQMINQGTQILENTYFGQYADPDVGTAVDDFVGCDVQRGLGYAYNGDVIDPVSPSSEGYGAHPPAVGIDFFEGPYQDNDDKDNPLSEDIELVNFEKGIPYSGLGLGYGDGRIDNERFGMKKFVYYNNGPNDGINDPETSGEFYNYLRGIWRDGTPLTYGNTGYQDGSIPSNYMFPYNSDPLNYGTNGVEVEPWHEAGEADNAPGDRRFIQSAGPFTLEPGQWNNITVGVVYARSFSGTPFSSVEKLLTADDKAQALFDNCFELIEGPTAPDLTIQEMDNKLIFALSNEGLSTNNRHETAYDENLVGFDPIIPPFDGEEERDTIDRSYLFQGYLVYQLANKDVSVTELNDPDKARIVFQCDVQDSISSVYNFTRDDDLPFPVANEMVRGENQGITHSFVLEKDAFAQGDDALVNHKSYYYMPIAYAYNNFEPYNLETLTGQSTQFLPSRKSSKGSIQTYTGIPHKVDPENGGTIVSSSYGDGVEITRIEGKGNGFQILDLTKESEDEIVANGFAPELTYSAGKGPVHVKVIDPTRVKTGSFVLSLASENEEFEDSHWRLIETVSNDTIYSNKTFQYKDEFLLLDYGISITFNQYKFEDPDLYPAFHKRYTDFIESSKVYDDPNKNWLSGVQDQEGFNDLNWIRSGNVVAGDEAEDFEVVFNDALVGDFYTPPSNDPDDPDVPIDAFFDINSNYENAVDGTWSPFCLTSISMETISPDGVEIISPQVAPRSDLFNRKYDWTFTTGDDFSNNIKGLNNVDIVFTSDTSKWTRCGVIEMQVFPELTHSGTAKKMFLRESPSVDKMGRKVGDSGYNDWEGTLNGQQTNGMGWFPGYAIDLGTGERLNLCFGENSFLEDDNGNDMIFNPSSRQIVDFTPRFGGQHWIYVFKNDQNILDNNSYMPAYDKGQFIYDELSSGSNAGLKRVFAACSWVGSTLANENVPMLDIDKGLIPTKTRIRLRVAKPYEKFSPSDQDLTDFAEASNFWNPMYKFNTSSISTIYHEQEVLEDALECINVVPNPYYAYSEYENNKLDNRVKITNLPEECTVRIYNLSGTLVRSFKKADPLTSIDWNLTNHKNIPIAGGVYLIHVNVPNVGEKIIKWFGVLRPIDLDNF